MEHVHPLQLVLLGLLAAVAVVAALARRLSASYSILLVIVGLLCSLLPHVPRVPLPPSAVFYGFLPPLLYAAAWQTSWREFRHHLVSISMLAIGLVFFTALGVALMAHWFMPGFDWRLGFLLGAIVSPTDAPAATSIAKRLGLPHTIVDLLEGESLVNDATGLLALQFGLDMIVNGQAPSFAHGLLEFAWLLLGGIGVGLLIGWLVLWFERWIEDGPIEIALSLIVAYVTYFAGEAVHASGVIAVVVTGLYLSRRSASLFSPQSRLQVRAVWSALEFLLNGFVFLLIGLQLPYVLEAIHGYSLLRLCGYGLAFSAVLIALRLVWVFPAARFAFLLRIKLLHQHYRMPERRALFVLGWTGMRGVVALAAATSLPETLAGGRPLPQRNMIVFLTFAVIVVTLVLQGLTLPAVVRALGFDPDREPQDEEDEARRLLLQSAIDYLQREQSTSANTNARVYKDLLGRLQVRMEELTATQKTGDTDAQDYVSARTLLLSTFRKQREELNTLRGQGRIGDNVYRTLERELDLGESQLASQQ